MNDMPAESQTTIHEIPRGLDISLMRNFMNSLLRNMQGGVFTVDLEHRVTSFNKAAEWISGYCLDDVQGKPCSEIMGTSICDHSCPLAKIHKTRSPVYKDEIQIKSKYGREIPVSLTCAPLEDNDGELAGMIGIFRDISELKTLRGQLMQSEKLVIMGQLAAGVAHEINNPITGILTYIKLMKKKLEKLKLPPKASEDFDKYLSVMERETSNVGRITKNLLDFSRRSEPDIRPTDLNVVIDQSLLLMRDQFKVRNVQLVKEGSSSVPKIMGDMGQLQQVFVNLILNAIQAMPKGGTLNVKIWAEGREGSECFVNVEITDTGVGISEEDIPRIFDPFFTTKKEKGRAGLGLGLSIVHSIVNKHHGRIRVTSKLEEGTTFSIRFPTA
jgi:two-component system NtrC family sensor kinase